VRTFRDGFDMLDHGGPVCTFVVCVAYLFSFPKRFVKNFMRTNVNFSRKNLITV
jgi:hypothetical protein